MRRYFLFAAVMTIIAVLGNAPALAQTVVNVPGFEQAPFTNASGAWLASSIADEPDGSETVGRVYLVAPVGLGDFSTHSNNIAILTANQGWYFITPSQGMKAYVQDTNVALIYLNSAWGPDSSGGGSALQCAVHGDATTDDAGNLNTCLSVAATNHISTVTACGTSLISSADLTIPAGVTLDLCSQTPSARANLDYRPSAFGKGVLVLANGHTITFGTGDASGLKNGVIEQGTGAYAPATFVPATLRDKVNVAGAFAGTAVTLPGNTKAVHLHDLMILGFTTGITSNSKGLRWDHIYTDATNCYDVNNSADVAHLEDIVCIPYLTKGGALSWEIDNILADGAGHYKLVAEAPTSDIQWTNGDEIYVSTTVGGGAQSANGLHTFSCSGTAGACSTVASGTDGCVAVAGCQEAVMSDTQSAASTFTATWTAGLRSDGTSQPLVTASDLTYVVVGQTLTGKCDGGVTDAFPANTTVLDKLPDLGWIIPSAAPLCAGTARTLTATDDVFVKTKRGAEMSPAQRHGIGFRCRNSGGITVWNLHSYTHDTELDLEKGCHQFRATGPSFGENDPLAEDDLTTVIVSGDHDGDDADNVWLENCTLGQHATVSLSVNTDSKGNNNFVNCGVGPAAGHKNGTLIRLLAGHVLFSNGGGAVPGNVVVADGQTFHVTQIDPRNDGTGYTVGDVLTGTLTCSTTPQYTVTKVDPIDLSVTAGTETRAGVGCTWPTNADGSGASFATTGGTGTSAELMTDGFVPATLQMTNAHIPQADVYVQTPGGSSFTGINNVCLLQSACNGIAGSEINSGIVGAAYGGNGLLVPQSYGARCDGSTDDTASITTWKALINLGAGFVPYNGGFPCKTTLSQNQITGHFVGPGRIQDTSGNWYAPNYYQISAAPTDQTTGAVVRDESNFAKSFNSPQFANMPMAFQLSVIGANTLGSDTDAGYKITPQASGIYGRVINTSGKENRGTDGSDPLRTGLPIVNIVSTQAGQGDLINFFSTCSTSGTQPTGLVHWEGGKACVFMGGSMSAFVSNSYLEGLGDLDFNDRGFDVTAIAFVPNFFRANGAEAKGNIWTSERPQNFGPIAMDSFYNPWGPTNIGIDLSTITFPNLTIATHSLAGGGSGYVVGDMPCVSGGTASGSKTCFRVTAVDGSGAITTYALENYGFYTAAPSSPAAVTGGTGTGATFNVAFDGNAAIALPANACIYGNVSNDSSEGYGAFSNTDALGTVKLCSNSGGFAVTGNLSSTTFNKVTLTQPATGSTLTIANGKTLTASNTVTLTATDGSTLAIGSGGTLGSNAYTSTAYAPLASPTFTGTVTLPEGTACTSSNCTLGAAVLANAKGITGLGSISGNVSTSFQLSNQASTATAPTLVPNRGSVTTGIGGASGTVALIVSGASVAHTDGTGFILDSGSYYSGATQGLTCSGAPTASFASTNGIVTHC